jgi:hypothetical protein
MCKLEKLKNTKREMELVVFSTFLWLWANIIIYKKALLLHGSQIIWQNLPDMLYRQNFVDVNIIQALLKIGILPFFFGILMIYRGFFDQKNKAIYLYISFAFATAIMLWLKLISLILGFIFLGVVLVVLFGNFYVKLGDYLLNTKISHFKPYIVIAVLAVFFVTSIIPSFVQYEQKDKSITQYQIEALEWLGSKVSSNSVVLSSPQEGYLIPYYLNAKNVIDENYLFADDSVQRLEDIKEIYTTHFKTRAVLLLNKYDVKYILLSDSTMDFYDITNLEYQDNECIVNIFRNSGVRIFESRCNLNE